MLKKKKTNPKYKQGDMLWIKYYPEDCQYLEGYVESEKDWFGPYLVLELIHEENLLRNESFHNNIDIPSILFDPAIPQWYYRLLSDSSNMEVPIREDYLVIFSSVNE